MDPVTQHLISSYLLMPVLTVIFGIAAYFIARKNKLLNNKKLIVYLLLCGIVLALPGLSGFMDYSFMPYIYVLLAILYWTAGYYNRFLLRKVFASGKETPSFGIRCLLTVTVVLGRGFLLIFDILHRIGAQDLVVHGKIQEAVQPAEAAVGLRGAEILVPDKECLVILAEVFRYFFKGDVLLPQ